MPLAAACGSMSHPRRTVRGMGVDVVATVEDRWAAVRELPAEELVHEVIVGVSEQSAHQALWLARVAEVDRRELWGIDGARSCAHWLAWKCGLDPRTAREHVRVAHRLDELRLVRSAFGEGRLSYSKVRALTRVSVASVEAEAFLLELALETTASHLERALVAYEKAHAAPITLGQEIDRRAKCGVTRFVDAEGLVHYEVVAPPEEALLIDKGIDFGRDELYAERKAAFGGGEADSGSGERPRRPTGAFGRLEGLTWVLRNGLANLARGAEVGDPYLIVVQVKEASALVADDGRVDLGNGLAVHPRVLQQLCCSSMIQAMLVGDDGRRPLDLGRRARLAQPEQKTALAAVYPACEFPGCEVPVRWCQFHHVRWWGRDAGGSDLDNFRPLCRRHHSLVHEGGWNLVIDPTDRLVAISPRGRRFDGSQVLTDEAVSHESMVADLEAMGFDIADFDDPERHESLGGRCQGERMTKWARETILMAHAAADEGRLTNVDGAFSATEGPTLRT